MSSGTTAVGRKSSASRELRSITATISSFVLLEATRYELGRKRLDRSAMPPETMRSIGDLIDQERANLATAIRGITRNGTTRSAMWWRKAISQVCLSDPSPADDANTKALEPVDAIAAMATIALYLELSVRALDIREKNADASDVDKAIAGLSMAQRILFAQRLAKTHITWPANHSNSWWLNEIEAVRGGAIDAESDAEAATENGIEVLIGALSLSCM